MKKWIIALAALLTTLALCAGAAAENSTEELYGQVTSMLFYTDNLTLKVKAEFSLNGEWFKTLDGLWMQDHDRSFRQVLLTSPKKDGTELHNGYTIVAAGEDYAVMEVCHPGEYKTGTTAGRTSILRRTTEAEQLIRLGDAITAREELLGDSAVTGNEDGSVRVLLNEESPQVANVMLNMLAQFAAKRYFHVDSDTLDPESAPSVWYYRTITQGLIYSMRDIRLQRLDATVEMDENGWPKEAKGEISMDVTTAADGVLQLDIRFTAEVSDWDSTLVKKFNPADYGVVPADGVSAMPYGNPELTTDERTGAMFDRALEVWKMTGYDIGEIVANSYQETDDGYHEILYIREDGTALRTLFNEEGKVVDLETEPHAWEDMELDYDFDVKIDEAKNAGVLTKLNAFLREVDPDLAAYLKDRGMVLHAERQYEIDGVTYVDYCEDPLDQEEGGVVFAVRFGPEPWIEYFTTISNG